MADNILTFPGVAPRRGGRNEEVIDMLNRVLAEAEAGNVVSLALTAMTADQSIITAIHRYPEASVFALLGAASALHAKLLRDIEGLDE